jgi:hypothetical protein
VRVIREFLGALSLSDISDDSDDANDVTSLVAQRRVVTLKESGASSLGYGIGTVFSHQALSRQGFEKIFILPSLLEERKDLKSALSEDLISSNTRDTFHGAVPGDITTLAIKGEYAVDARFDQGSMKEALVW